ncbi:TRAP transporter TatT component family protein [bacterium]|nr:TRAP transporter TatT component family protein [bacterium]
MSRVKEKAKGKNKVSLLSLILIFAVIFLGSSGCSLKKFVIRKVANALTGEGSTVFTGDNDPQLVADALPFALKLYESLLEADGENTALLKTTGMAFSMYAYAFVQQPANYLPSTEFDLKRAERARAKQLFLRAYGYLLTACNYKFPGFKEAFEAGKISQYTKDFKKEDISLLYWTSMSLMGAYSLEKFDMDIAMLTPSAVGLLKECLLLDEAYGDGLLHEFFITYYGSMPPSMGGSEEKAREHYKRAMELSRGEKCGPYVALATSISVKNQDRDEFNRLLDSALKIDPEADPSNRLQTLITQKHARWLKEHSDDMFLE